MKSVGVYCGSAEGTRPRYLEISKQVGRALATRDLELVYGGAKIGLMGAMADAALEAGGRVFGVLPAALSKVEIAHPGLTEFRVAGSMHERKAMMAMRSDAFVALPGGYGTLDEIFEALTWAQVGIHQKPCALLNVDGFFDSLIEYLDHATSEGFIRPMHRPMLLVETDFERLLDRLQLHFPASNAPIMSAHSVEA
ncbi:MAG: TIGR00730 family Rossman fold protein [Myxococcales bacterium]